MHNGEAPPYHRSLVAEAALPPSILAIRSGNQRGPELLHLVISQHLCDPRVYCTFGPPRLLVTVAPIVRSNQVGKVPSSAYFNISSRVIRANSSLRLTCSLRPTHGPLELIFATVATALTTAAAVASTSAAFSSIVRGRGRFAVAFPSEQGRARGDR